jgi:hypothetical protein
VLSLIFLKALSYFSGTAATLEVNYYELGLIMMIAVIEVVLLLSVTIFNFFYANFLDPSG